VQDNVALLPVPEVYKGLDSMEYRLETPEGTSRATSYVLIPGMSLIFFDIHAASLPSTEENQGGRPQFNFCISGRIEMLFKDDIHFYLKRDEFSFSTITSKNDSFFPTKSYQGIALLFDVELLSTSCGLVSEIFDLDILSLLDKYCETDIFLFEANDEIRLILDRILLSHLNSSLFHMRLHVIELLHLLLNQDSSPAAIRTFYTPIQVRIAKKTAEILSADLRRHIPVRILAEQFSVSETSLKNYFHGVFGQNISSWLREIRMKTAADLLTKTQMPISEISCRVGYTKQGRFAAVFRQQYQMNPLEYRRTRRLESRPSLRHSLG
jgi:AraC-like DNA-binding protein